MDSPRGRIYLLKAVQEGRLSLTDPVVRHIDLCLGCRACEAACPSGVQYGVLLEHGRDYIERHYKRNLVQRWLRRVFIEAVLPYPSRMRLALLPVRLLQKLGLDQFFARLPLFRSLAFLPDLSRTASPPLPEITPAQGNRNARVGMISGCVMSVLFGKTNEATVRLLSRAGCEVVTPAEQVCCGALFLHGGSMEKGKECARRTIEAFEKHALDTIVINAAGCGSTLKEYGKLLAEDPQYAERAALFSSKVKDLSETLREKKFQISNATCKDRVTYHDACHLAHAQGIKSEPRSLVRAVKGIEFIELNEADLCCGSAGSYNLTEPEMANQLQQRKIDNLKKTGADIVVTTNPGCILQIQAGLRKARSPMKVMHLADFLDQNGRDLDSR
jgi:glycolate oxidase iron-sulfur subunit